MQGRATLAEKCLPGCKGNLLKLYKQCYNLIHNFVYNPKIYKECTVNFQFILAVGLLLKSDEHVIRFTTLVFCDEFYCKYTVTKQGDDTCENVVSL